MENKIATRQIPLRAIFKSIGAWLVSAFFILAGTYHFLRPAPFIAMVPPWLPSPATLVAISGIAEIAGGIGVLIPRFRRCAAWSLIVLLIAVFPANLQVARYGWPGVDLPPWVLWLRLPFQLLFIWAVHRCYLARSTRTASRQPG